MGLLRRGRPYLEAMLAATRTRLLIISRYPGQLFLDVFIPIVMAGMPILLGRAVGGANAAQNFAANTGTPNYVAYMLLGSSVFTIVSYAFWHLAWWVRWEQETGTLEALYLTPTPSVFIAAGTATYSFLRSIFTATVAYLLGCWIFGVNPFQGQVGLAYVFILVGLLPLYGMALLFGALVLRVKQANALINLMQWGVSFLMGVYFPVHFLPPLLRALALAFPPTWMTNGARAAILGVGYFLGTWYRDLAVLWVFLASAPLLGWQVFRSMENRLRRNEGLGQY